MKISSLSTTLSIPSSLHKPAISSSNSSLFLNPSTSTFLPSARISARTRPAISSRNGRRRGLSCTCLFGLGVPELAVIAGVAALVFGPKQIPEIGRSIGRTVKGFQQAAKEFESELKKPDESESPNEAIEAKPASGSSEEKQNANVSASKDSS